MNCLQNPPKLTINKVLYDNRGASMPVHVRLEQRIVWNLLLTLEKHGFKVSSVHDGEEQTRVVSKKHAMELLFNLDDAYLFLRHVAGVYPPDGNHPEFWIRFVFGNELDIISDYSATKVNGFQAIVDKFDPEVYA